MDRQPGLLKDVAASALFVSTFGQDRPLLCLHGIEAHGLRFAGIATRLHDVQVVAPDLRGHASSPRSGPWTLEQHVLDVAPILRGLGPDTVVLGHSYGGLIAWELARAFPGDLRGLVLADPAIGVPTATAQWGIDNSGVHAAWPDERSALEGLLAQREPSAWWAAALEFVDTLERTPDGGLKPSVSEEAVRAGWTQMREPIRSTQWRGPTLLLEAARENGRFIPEASVALMREQLGEALDHRLLDVTHTIPSDHPGLLADLVTEFLQRVAR